MKKFIETLVPKKVFRIRVNGGIDQKLYPIFNSDPTPSQEVYRKYGYLVPLPFLSQLILTEVQSPKPKASPICLKSTATDLSHNLIK